MIKILLIDFAQVLLFYKTKKNIESLNNKYTELKKESSSYNPLDTFIINQELLDYISKKNSNGYTSYIFTSGYTHADPQIEPILKHYFKKVITTTDIGFPKSFKKSFELISKFLNIKTNEIVFVDDQVKNVKAAKTAGIKAIQFTNTQETISEIEKALNSPN